MSGPPRNQSYGRQNEDLLGSAGYSSGQMTGPGALPGALQAGRPGLGSANTAPSSVPTLPPLAITSHQNVPSRGSSASQSHSYSRSSPAAALSDDQGKYTTPQSQKYMGSHTPQTATGYSPLGLADIRPQQDANDGPSSANPFQDFPPETTSCSYHAPWAVYAMDWCKWPIGQQNIGDSAGKVALGSYIEDGHNYVRMIYFCYDGELIENLVANTGHPCDQ